MPSLKKRMSLAWWHKFLLPRAQEAGADWSLCKFKAYLVYTVHTRQPRLHIVSETCVNLTKIKNQKKKEEKECLMAATCMQCSLGEEVGKNGDRTGRGEGGRGRGKGQNGRRENFRERPSQELPDGRSSSNSNLTGVSIERRRGEKQPRRGQLVE